MTRDEVTLRDLLERDVRELHRALEQIGHQMVSGQEASRREHAQVRMELRELRGALDGMVPRSEHATFKQHVYDRLDAHDGDLDSRRGADRMLARLAAIVIGSATVGGIVLGVVQTLS